MRRFCTLLATPLRLLTADRRILPDYFIIGGQKCGTTSLYFYLIQHPSILPASKKEIHYFNRVKNRHKGEKWYRSHFPAAIRLKTSRRQFITGEATPLFYHYHAPQLIAEMNPDIKLILLLRDPIDRAFSHYQHNHRRHIEHLSFSDAVRREKKRIQAEIDRTKQDPTYSSSAYHRYSYLYRGYYALHLKRWFKFFPREQFLIIDSQEFDRFRDTILAKVMGFLDLPQADFNTRRSWNITRYSQSLPRDIQAYLKSHFQPHNQHLFDLLNREFPWK